MNIFALMMAPSSRRMLMIFPARFKQTIFEIETTSNHLHTGFPDHRFEDRFGYFGFESGCEFGIRIEC
jgi:hypothetical protein